MPTPIYFTTTEVACIWNILPDTLRKHVRQFGQYRSVKPRKLPSGDLAWPRAAILATLDDSDLTEGQRDALAALEACTGPLKLTPDEREALLGAIYSVPYAERHNLPRLLAQIDLAHRALRAADRAELTSRVDRGDHSTSLSPDAQRRLAAALTLVIDCATTLRQNLLDAAEKAEKAERGAA